MEPWLCLWQLVDVYILTSKEEQMLFDDPSVKDFMIHVVKHSLGIMDSWINKQYQLDKCVICPGCKRKIVIGKDADLVKSNKI